MDDGSIIAAGEAKDLQGELDKLGDSAFKHD
jgi:hypothetical protein